MKRIIEGIWTEMSHPKQVDATPPPDLSGFRARNAGSYRQRSGCKPSSVDREVGRNRSGAVTRSIPMHTEGPNHGYAALGGSALGKRVPRLQRGLHGSTGVSRRAAET